MALVDRQVAGLEYKVERELAAQCGTWQQLNIMKKKYGEKRENPSSCEGMTRSERLLWYRRNQPAIELDNYRVSCSSNYRQLQLARGQRCVEESEEEKLGRDRTKSEALLWYRNGGMERMEEEKAMANLCGTWKQFHLMTRGRAEERDEDQVPTRSERLCWYRNGGSDLVDARNNLARDSSNWMQYKLTRDRQAFSANLEDRMNTSWSQFKNKNELSDHFAEQRNEEMDEREKIRTQVRNRISKESMAKTTYEINRQSREKEELEEESDKKVEAALSKEERIEKLRCTTESMLTHRTEYIQSTRELALQAMREDQEAVAAARQSRKKVTVVEQAGTVAA
eukprot:GFUD01034159.1.p1 GENE.GFUD01034159.1~~GFUD01034159.1.p1  ORF type:complete len:339 (+),score=136.24 GFUD01034159.1:151-1167(+)